MKKNNHTLWVERYRPIEINNYIGNDHLKSKIEIYLESGDLPHLLLHGKAGTGKTTLAKLLVKNIDCDHLYINASDENGVDGIRFKVKNFASTVGFKDMKVIILDECDYITPNAQAALRNVMETFSKHCRFILTCNYVERIIDPIQSRCQSFQVIPPNKNDVAKHLHNILTDEDVSYEREDLGILVNSGYPDIRRVINGAQRQSYNGKITGITKDINNFADLFKHLKSKDFKAMRKWISDNMDIESSAIYRGIYDQMYDYLKPQSIPQIVLILADYQYKQAFVADHELNIVACMTEIMANVEFA